MASAVPSWWARKGPVPDGKDNSGITAKWFPKGFLFGTATSAFQVEGAARKGGKVISVWDEFSIKQPWHIADGSNGNVACDMYHRYKEDIQMMKEMGFNSYRFSIAWTRILPGGRRSSGGVNEEGIAYYKDVIRTVIEHGMTPFVTIYHWDLPLCLEKEYGGFLSEQIKDEYAENHLMTKVKGYFVWSWCDDNEWESGYTVRFGLVYTDYMNYLTRHPKGAADWFTKFLKSQKEPPSWFDPCWYVKPMLEAENGSNKENGVMNGTDKTLMLVEN